MYKLLLMLIMLFFTTFSMQGASAATVLAPQATSCVQGSFTNQGTSWKTIYLKLTNKCGQTVDFQNSTITFSNASNLNTSFWGNFNPLSYPDNNLQITSQQQSAGNYVASLNLHFPTDSWANTKLPNGSSITIIYGATSANYVADSVKVYLGTPVNTAEIDLINSAAQPANVTQSYALVHLTFNGQPLSDVQVPWSSTQKIMGVAAGTYVVSPANITDSNGNVYQASANPSTFTLATGQVASSTISYTLTQPTGNIAFNVQTLPSQLGGYTGNPSVKLTNQSTGGATTKTVNWNTTTTVSQLSNGSTYTFSSPTISFNGYNCVPKFSAASAVASTTAPIVNLTYSCTQVALDTVTINVSGLSSSTSSVDVVFTPNNNSTPIIQTVNLTNGQGSATVQLTDGTVYTVTSGNITSYTASYNPQPLTATANAVETITYSSSSANRIIGYLAGWKTPPSATELANAGYTHILVAFGVFSTTNPGQVVPAFDTVSASYIKSLQNAGIKVLLSLGGASTSIPNTTVNFHQVLQMTSQATFVQNFTQSLDNLITQYGFDGFDIDIESGLNAGGTFTTPQGDIMVLANIINTMHSNHPSLLLTLTPQTANVAATSGFDAVWGNYASLIMQTYHSLSWVGIQLYNTGCMLGLNSVCYDANATNNPDFTVAMAADLLENWPTSSGFQPYISYLNPSQVVLGYLIPNASGQGDGGPVIPNTTIKRAIQCLRTGVVGSNSCGSYVPPRLYPNIGGVFGWEVSYDQANGYKFSSGLKSCVMSGNCN